MNTRASRRCRHLSERGIESLDQERLRGAGHGTRREVDEEVGLQRSMKMPSDSCFALLFPSRDCGALGNDPTGRDKEWTEKRLKQNPPR